MLSRALSVVLLHKTLGCSLGKLFRYTFPFPSFQEFTLWHCDGILFLHSHIDRSKFPMEEGGLR